MLSSKLFPWQKNKKKHTIHKNEKNEELIQELRSEGIEAEIIETSELINKELKNTGSSVKKREDVHKMAESNRAFAHYRW